MQGLDLTGLATQWLATHKDCFLLFLIVCGLFAALKIERKEKQDLRSENVALRAQLDRVHEARVVEARQYAEMGQESSAVLAKVMQSVRSWKE